MAQKQGRPSSLKINKDAGKQQYATQKRTEFFCSCCGTKYNKLSGNFLVSRSPLYVSDGYLPVCKSCLENVYQHYIDVFGDELSAIERVCMKFDMYFNLPIAQSSLSTSAGKSVISNYISIISLPQYKLKNFDTTLNEYDYLERSKGESIVEENKIQEEIKQDAAREWGLTNLSLDDIQFLNEEFADWNARNDISGKSRENLVRDLCVIRLQCNKALDNGDVEAYSKLSANYQKALQAASLMPKQVEETEKLNELPLGVLIRKIEDEEPIPEPLPEFRDCDKIQSKILAFFIGHLCSMLHIKNKYEQQYHDVLEQYAAVNSEEIAAEDDEDIYEYLMNNGFSTLDRNTDESDDGGSK